MIERQSGDLAQLCGLLNTLSGFKQFLQNPSGANLGLDTYPMAEFWSEIFDDHRILDFAGGLAASCGLPQPACRALENLVRSLTEFDEARAMTDLFTNEISLEIGIAIDESKGWRREHCDLEAAPTISTVDVSLSRPGGAFAVGGDG